MTEAWVMKWCKTCREPTIHDHRSGQSSKATWQETKCQLCSRVTNITIRNNSLERV